MMKSLICFYEDPASILNEDSCPEKKGKDCCQITGKKDLCRCGEGACGGADVDVEEPPFQGK